MNTTFTIDRHQFAVFEDIARSLRTIAASHQGQGLKVGGFNLMFVTKDDQPDVPFQIKPTFVDSEGNPVPAPTSGVTYEATSTDDSVVSILPDTSTPPDPAKGTVHFGNPGQASLNFNILLNGKLAGALGAQFTVVVGDPAKVAGGTVEFTGLTES